MSSELKDQRIPVMMAPSEVKAIEDWMFENRLRSRADAIRSLVERGLVFDNMFDALEAADKAFYEILENQNPNFVAEYFEQRKKVFDRVRSYIARVEAETDEMRKLYKLYEDKNSNKVAD